MAGAQPLEEKTSQPAPGAFPETPANEEQQFSVNPIPASEGQGNPIQLAPGEKVPDQASFNTNTVESGVHDDPELKAQDEEKNQTMSVNPIPASGGAGNPIQLAPGEKVPDSKEVTGNTVDSTVKTDQASYEKSDAGAGIMPVQPNPDTDPVAAGLGPQTESQIPESSMGMGKDAPADISKEDTGPTISSVAPNSTTNDMAGQVPLEEKREATVVDEDKKDDSEKKGVFGAIAGGAAAATAALAGGAYAANEKTKESTGSDPKSSLPEGVQKAMDENAKEPSTSSVPQQAHVGESLSTPNGGDGAEPASAVPEEVVQSQKEADAPAEASANPEAVEEKSEMEKQLLSKVEKSDATGEPAPEASAPSTGSGILSPLKPVDAVPVGVAESQKEAKVEPEAAANAEAVKEKSEVENELLNKVPEENAAGEPAPTASAAAATTAPAPTSDETTSASGAPQLGDPTAGVAALSMDDKTNKPSDTLTPPAAEDKPMDSRDVSPMSRPVTNQPEGAAAATENTPTPRPQKDSNSTPAKRQSIVDKLKVRRHDRRETRRAAWVGG